jgi:hypothetical protein
LLYFYPERIIKIKVFLVKLRKGFWIIGYSIYFKMISKKGSQIDDKASK